MYSILKFLLVLRIKSEAIDFCPEHEKDDEEIKEAQSPTAPLNSLDDLIRPLDGAVADHGTSEIDEERYVVKAVPMDTEKDAQVPAEEVAKDEPSEQAKVVEGEHKVEVNQSVVNAVSTLTFKLKIKYYVLLYNKNYSHVSLKETECKIKILLTT